MFAREVIGLKSESVRLAIILPFLSAWNSQLRVNIPKWEFSLGIDQILIDA